ncbi:hypothetical protein QFZ74_002817 [Streptomyces sp. V3I7]|nr:hypothetical protein [Streptomyces sp. V3I7]
MSSAVSGVVNGGISKVRKWEPEPLRWLGVHALYAAYRTADHREHLHPSAEPSRLARIADRVTGRH